MKTAGARLGRWVAMAWLAALGILAAGSAARGQDSAPGGDVYTNPLNQDPQVQEAFQHFYDLDYTGAVERFEKFHEEHPGDPEPTALLLEAEVFQELYRLDLLDTTFYATNGFLSGRHATVEDAAAKARIMGLADEAIREADWRIGRNPNDVDALYARGVGAEPEMHLPCHGGAEIRRGLPAGDEGQGRRRAGAGTEAGLRGREAGGGGV